jgi:hypothetical protein
MPLRPAESAAQVSAAEFPQGVTAPIPVMATRRRANEAGFIEKRGKSAILLRDEIRAAVLAGRMHYVNPRL